MLDPINKMYDEPEVALHNPAALTIHNPNAAQLVKSAQPIIIEESLSLADKEKDMITKALSKYKYAVSNSSSR